MIRKNLKLWENQKKLFEIFIFHEYRWWFKEDLLHDFQLFKLIFQDSNDLSFHFVATHCLRKWNPHDFRHLWLFNQWILSRKNIHKWFIKRHLQSILEDSCNVRDKNWNYSFEYFDYWLSRNSIEAHGDSSRKETKQMNLFIQWLLGMKVFQKLIFSRFSAIFFYLNLS